MEFLKQKMKAPLKTLFVSPSMGAYGGLEAFTLAIAEGINSTAEITATILFKKAGAFVLGGDLACKVRESAVPVKFCEKLSMRLVQAIIAADVVHLQNPCPDVTLLAKLFCKPLLTQVINHREGGSSIHQRIWQMCLSMADRRLYISDFVRSTWDPDRRLENSYVLFPICKLAEGFTPISERRGFTFLGRWIANKGIETLVEAYCLAGLNPHEWPLRLMGEGPLKDSIMNYLAQENVHGVEVLGFVDDVIKAEVIRSSRFMVIPPDTKEDFGLTAIEARNLGVPCIITRDGGLPEAAGQFVISCDPGSVEGLVRALRVAAGMTAGDYAKMAESTYRSLQNELAHPEDYRKHYRALSGDGTGRTRRCAVQIPESN